MSEYKQEELTAGGKVAVLAIAIVVLGSFVFLYYKFSDISAEANTIHEQLIDKYLVLIQAKEYEAAYDLLGADLHKTVSLQEFSTAHIKRSQELGPLVQWKDINVFTDSNLFSGENRMGLKYVLDFGVGGDGFALYYVDLNSEPYRIVETLGSIDRSDNLRPDIW